MDSLILVVTLALLIIGTYIFGVSVGWAAATAQRRLFDALLARYSDDRCEFPVPCGRPGAHIVGVDNSVYCASHGPFMEWRETEST